MRRRQRERNRYRTILFSTRDPSHSLEGCRMGRRILGLCSSGEWRGLLFCVRISVGLDLGHLLFLLFLDQFHLSRTATCWCRIKGRNSSPNDVDLVPIGGECGIDGHRLVLGIAVQTWRPSDDVEYPGARSGLCLGMD